MKPIRLVHYVIDSEVELYGMWGMPMVYYVVSHNIFIMHPRAFPEFEKLMWVVGMELTSFGENNESSDAKSRTLYLR